MSVLAIATLMALATNPACGRADPDREFAQRLAAIAIKESGGDPLVIGVNPDASRGLPGGAVRSATAQEAASKARGLIAQGRSIDLGLMQINSANLARHGLTVETAFDQCANMRAGADHYAADVASVWSLAHRRYNTGGTTGGAAYAAGVEQVLARVRGQSASPAPRPVAQPAEPPAPLCAPSWDAWALAACSAIPAAHPTTAAGGASPVTVTFQGPAHAD